MLLEFRFNQLRSGCLPEYESRFQKLLPERDQLSPLLGFWSTDVGSIDQVLELWSYHDAAHRNQVLWKAASIEAWVNLETSDLHQVQTSRLVSAAPFSPPLKPNAYGTIYELRIYDYEAGAIPRVMQRWQQKLPERIPLSPLILCGHSVSGRLGQWFHLWAYKDPFERQRIRAEAVRRKVWPPESPGGLIRQRNVLLVPSSFSPLR